MISKILNSNLVSKLILVFVSLLPIFYLPLKISSLAYSKFLIVYVFAFAITSIFIYSRFIKKDFNFKLNLISGSIGLILLSYSISTLFSKNFSISFWGRDFSQDSWITIVSLFAITLIISSVSKKKDVLNIIWAIVISSGIISIVQLLYIFFPSLPSIGLFYSKSNNLVGKVNDLILFASIGIVIASIALEQVVLSTRFKQILYGIIGINLALVAIGNFYLSKYMLVGFGIFYLAYKFIIFKKINQKFEGKELSFFSPVFFVTIFCILLIFFGDILNSNLLGKLNMNYLEVRPSVVSTMDINKATLKGDLLFGTGPSTFESQWPLYRSSAVLNSEFWNLDFRFGHGILLSFPATVGIFGIISWLILFILLSFYILKSIKINTKDFETKFILDSVAFLTVFLWIVNLIYIPTIVMFSLAFVFTGMLITLLVDLKTIKQRKFIINSFFGKILSAIIFAVVIVLFIAILLRFSAQIYFQRSMNIASEKGDLNTVKSLVEKAINLNNIDVYSRSIARANSSMLFTNISKQEELKADYVTKTIAEIVTNYEKSIKYDPNNYYNYIEFADFYTDLVTAGISKDDSYKAALLYYKKSFELKPNNPFVELRVARLEFMKGNYQLSKDALIRSIVLKPDYLDAYISLSQLELEYKNNSEAIRNIEEYLKIFPNNVNAMYQLAVVHIQLENYDEAIAQFEKIYTIDKREEIKQWIQDIKLKKNSVQN